MTTEPAPKGLLPVNEIFATVQGEALWTGTPAVFVRLQGCDVGCPWCDTRHSWVLDPANRVPLMDMLEKAVNSPTYSELSSEDLAEIVRGFLPRHVVLTGGEPCMHDLTDLSLLLAGSGWTVQVETSGTAQIAIGPDAWVTVSPKIGMPGGFAVLDDALVRADEIKMPVGRPADIEALFDLLDRGKHRPETLIWLQPLSLSRKATDLCVAAATANGFRVSIQMHALVGWR